MKEFESSPNEKWGIIKRDVKIGVNILPDTYYAIMPLYVCLDILRENPCAKNISAILHTDSFPETILTDDFC